jgi:TonB family protein
MDRLQKKCVIASTGFHLLLALILFIGPAFLAPKSKVDEMPVLDFVPLKTVDALVSGGGNPNARPPAAPLVAPPPPAVVTPPAAPQPERIKEADVPKEPEKEAKPTKPEPDSLEPGTDRKPKKPQISTNLVIRKRDPQAETKAREEEEASEAAAARRRLAGRIGKAADRIGNEVSGGTDIELKGPGGGGVPYANFLQAVKSVYQRAWIVPDGVTNDEATTVVSVTIGRDGTVISARILERSGDKVVDQSVQATLDRVRYAAPLPDEAKEDQRTVTISFNVKAKRLLG